MPAMMPALGASPPYMPQAASWPISRNGVPGSSSFSTRSRGSSLPRAVCLARAVSPPPRWTSAAFARKSSTSERIVSALAWNSAERGSIRDFRTSIARSLHRLAVQLAADQHPADLAGACADFVELRVAPEAAGRVFVDVAVAAQHLDRLAGHPGGLLGRVQDRAGGVLAQRARMVAAIAGLSHRIDIGAAGLPGRVQVGELALHQLELADALAELLALVHVGEHDVH